MQKTSKKVWPHHSNCHVHRDVGIGKLFDIEIPSVADIT